MNQSLTVGINGNAAGLQAAVNVANSSLSSLAASAATNSARLGGSVSQGFGQATQAAQSFAQQAQASANILTLAFSAPLALLGKQAVSTYADMDSLRRGLATLEKDSGSLQSRLTELAEVAKLPGLGKKEAIEFDIALRSAGIGADLSKKAMMAFGNALGSVGKGKNELKGVSAQLQQLATKTGGFGADIKVIKEYAPQVGAALMSAFGTVDTDAIAKTGVTGKEVIAKIVDELAKLPKATGGAKNGFENFEDAATSVFDAIGESLFKGLHIEDVLNTIAGAVGGLVEKFKSLPATTQTVIVSIVALAVAIPPLIAAVGFFTTTILPALRVGMALVRAQALAMIGPFGLIALAVGAAALLIIMHWDSVKKFLVDTGIWQGLKAVVGTALGVITGLFGIFANLFQGDWAALWEHAKNVFKYLWNGIISVFVSGATLIPRLLAKLAGGLGFDRLAENLNKSTEAYSGFLNGLKADVPKPTFDLFSGFNFGGQKDTGAGKAKTKKEKKKKEAAEPGQDSDYGDRTRTYIEKLKAQIEALKKDIESKLALGIRVPPDSIEQLVRLEKELIQAEEVGKNYDVSKLKEKFGELKRDAAALEAQIKHDLVLGILVPKSDFDKLKQLQDELKKVGDTVASFGTQKLEIRTNGVFGNQNADQMQTGLGSQQPKLPGLTTITPRLDMKINAASAVEGAKQQLGTAFTGFTSFLKPFGDQLTGAMEEAFNRGEIITPFQNAMQALQQSFADAKEQLTNGSVGIFASVGEAIGGGKNPLKAALKVILELVGDYLIKIGTAMLLAAKFLAFAAAIPGVGALFAGEAAGGFLSGAALVVGGGVVKGLASAAFAEGGLVTGPVMGLVGEGRGTSRSNPEVISPLNKLKSMIGDTGSVGGTLSARVSGNDLLILMERAQDKRADFRGY